MHEDPLKLIPNEFRGKILEMLNEKPAGGRAARTGRGRSLPRLPLRLQGSAPQIRRRLDQGHRPREGASACNFPSAIAWASERSSPRTRRTRTPTELTGDINYRKIAEYGSDSDPRAFNFDGEFNIANRAS